jgi:hypothetical protein
MFTGNPARRRAAGRGDWAITLPLSALRDCTFRTRPTEHFLARIFRFASPNVKNSSPDLKASLGFKGATLGTTQTVGRAGVVA